MRVERVSRAYLLGLPSLPGISPDETELILDFVEHAGRLYHDFSINVPVGPGDTSTPSLGAAIDRMWEAITRPRIDLVMRSYGATYIVEAKRHARFSAVTQVCKYVERFRREHQPTGRVYPIVLCRSHVRGLGDALISHNGALVVQRFTERSAPVSA